jgi:uncharacterized protein (DUF433 family)
MICSRWNDFHDAIGAETAKAINMTTGFEYISIDPQVCHGQACIKGTRIPVHQILSMMAHGDSVEDLLNEYPSLTREKIMACLDYASMLAEEEFDPLLNLAD